MHRAGRLPLEQGGGAESFKTETEQTKILESEILILTLKCENLLRFLKKSAWAKQSSLK